MITKKRSYHTLRDFFLVVFKHRRVVLDFFLLAFVSSVIACFVMSPVYEAASKLLVKNSGRDISADAGAGGQKSLETGAVIDTAVEMLTSRFLIEKVIQDIGVTVIYPGIGGAGLFDKLSELERAILRFSDNLDVRKGNVIEVRFQHRDGALAAAVVNRLVERFLDHYLSVHQQNQKYSFFKEQLALMEQKLQDAQKELGLFRNEQNISSIQKQKSLLLLQISDMEVDLGKTRGEISQQESLAESLKKSPESRPEIQQKLVALQSKAKKLQQQITQYRLELGMLDKAETRLNELERRVRIDEENYLLYSKKTEEARISSAMDEQKLVNFSIIEPSLPPISPIKPNKPLIIFVALLLGCAGGILLAFVSEYFTHTFDNPGDIEDIINCPAPASLPELTAAERAMLAACTISETMAEQCTRLKYHLERAVPDTSRRVILFNSAKEREGTSHALFAFGLALAGQGSSVLLIDANFRNPVLHRLCGLDPDDGLSDAIRSRAPARSVIRTTPVENLRLIAAGTPPQNPAAVLHEEHCGLLLGQAREQADWVLLDAPPVNVHNDAGPLAARVDGAVLVVKAGKTRWEVALSTVNQFRKFNLRLLAVLLTRQRRHIPEWLYKHL
jgi:capsular exopolysaccharide synthesis family protein